MNTLAEVEKAESCGAPNPQIPFWTIDDAFSAFNSVFPHAIGVTEGVNVLVGRGEAVGLGVEVGGSGVRVALGDNVGLGVGTVEVAMSGDGVDNTGG